MSNNVGAGMLNIITESLYDNPIVVFREYVQNSIDSIFSITDGTEKCEIKIWVDHNNLYFLDNGTGIDRLLFEDKMKDIGLSSKKKQNDLGYKGIGRLSGVPYCKKLQFINICDYMHNESQMYTIDKQEYEKIKREEDFSNLSFEDLMDKIGECNINFDLRNNQEIFNEIEKYKRMLETMNTGFLVILNDITSVLAETIGNDEFFERLEWLLPVDFSKSLYQSDQRELFDELTNVDEEGMIPARFCDIYFNDKQVLRPIQKEMLRDYVCKGDFKYAIGFHTFKGDKLTIDKTNNFSGIRIYIDNMLLCDESELIQNLEHYGLLEHTTNGQLQSVRGIAAMIYITDKINISANARRTFIEVTDSNSIEFLKLLAEFVNTIYDTRYAMSNYASAKAKQQLTSEKIQDLRVKALENLRRLAKEKVELTIEEDSDEQENFSKMNQTEKKRAIKRKINSQLDKKIKEYLIQLKEFNLEESYDDFIKWLNN